MTQTTHSTPAAAAASKLPFQIAAAAFSAYLLFRSAGDLAAANGLGAESFLSARIEPARLRDGSPAGPLGSLSDFGLLLGGCKLPREAAAWSNGSFEVRTDESMALLPILERSCVRFEDGSTSLDAFET